jgi:hypothetical protein
MSSLAHFADSSRTSPEVRDMPISDTAPAIPSPLRSDRASAISPNGCYGIWIGTAASVWLDARELDHLGPLLGFGGDELGEVGR